MSEIDDRQINANNARIASQFPEVIPRYVPEPPKAENQEPPKSEKADVKETKDKIKELLMAIYHLQYKKTSTEIYKLSGLPAGTGSRLLAECEKNNLIKLIQLRGRGNPKYPILTAKAYEVLGMQEKKFYGKGAGDEHVLWQHLIAEKFSKFKPIIEKVKEGKSIDVAIQTNELLICIEVAMTASNEKSNIEKNFEFAKADFVVIACKDNKVEDSVQAIVQDMPEHIKSKTEVYLLSELMSLKPDEFVENIEQGQLNI